jgi:hypothetical protein
MSSKASAAGAGGRPPETPDDGDRAELLRELARCGVGSELAERLATDLLAVSATLTPAARRGAVTGMALASAAHLEHAEALRRSQQDLAEIERMMGAFATELKKVDEAVKILATFVARIRQQSTTPPHRVVH